MESLSDPPQNSCDGSISLDLLLSNFPSQNFARNDKNTTFAVQILEKVDKLV